MNAVHIRSKGLLILTIHHICTHVDMFWHFIRNTYLSFTSSPNHNQPVRNRGPGRPLPGQLPAGQRGPLRRRPRQPAEDVGRLQRHPRHPPVRCRRRRTPVQVMRLMTQGPKKAIGC